MKGKRMDARRHFLRIKDVLQDNNASRTWLVNPFSTKRIRSPKLYAVSLLFFFFFVFLFARQKGKDGGSCMRDNDQYLSTCVHCFTRYEFLIISYDRRDAKK